MYEERFIAFVDILGFGQLVERSVAAPDLPKRILDALLSIHPVKINEEMYCHLNEDKIPPEELESVRHVARVFAECMRAEAPVDINYFSDSLVISARADNVIASQMVLDLLTKLSAQLWMDHKLLLRGGVSLGKLVHVENGPMFGPAMNRAYLLESKLAVSPRFLIDKECVQRYRTVPTFNLYESFLQPDGEFFYGSLATAFKHILNASSLALEGEDRLKRYREALHAAPAEIEALRLKFINDDRARPKYEWLAGEFAARIPEVAPAYPAGEK